MSPTEKPLNVLFLCTHNSARSQMAEGFLRALGGDRFEAASAGTEATRVHPLAIRVMDEVGIDLGGHSSKTFDEFLAQPWDCVITVCDNANERCPIFPARTTRLHWSFEDPSAATGSEEERLRVFRRIRGEIRGRHRQDIPWQQLEELVYVVEFPHLPGARIADDRAEPENHDRQLPRGGEHYLLGFVLGLQIGRAHV